jgi:hypothetical protein
VIFDSAFRFQSVGVGASTATCPLRIEYPGALYQVNCRGDSQEAIFDDDQVRTGFLNVLADVVSRFRWQRRT